MVFGASGRTWAAQPDLSGPPCRAPSTCHIVHHTPIFVPLLMCTSSWKPGSFSRLTATGDFRQRAGFPALCGTAGFHSPWHPRPQVTCPISLHPWQRLCFWHNWVVLLSLGKDLPQLLPTSRELEKPGWLHWPCGHHIHLGNILLFTWGNHSMRNFQNTSPTSSPKVLELLLEQLEHGEISLLSFEALSRWKIWSRPAPWPRILYLNLAFHMHFSNDSENLSSLKTEGQGGLRGAKWAWQTAGGVF